MFFILNNVTYAIFNKKKKSTHLYIYTVPIQGYEHILSTLVFFSLLMLLFFASV